MAIYGRPNVLDRLENPLSMYPGEMVVAFVKGSETEKRGQLDFLWKQIQPVQIFLGKSIIREQQEIAMERGKDPPHLQEVRGEDRLEIRLMPNGIDEPGSEEALLRYDQDELLRRLSWPRGIGCVFWHEVPSLIDKNSSINTIAEGVKM